jgi:hemerythrin superfamily protein
MPADANTDAITLITSDHRLLEQLFERLKADDGDRRALVTEIEARLSAHARAEETQVYPVIAKSAGEKDEVDHGTYEHLEAQHKLCKVRNLVDSPHFGQALEEFVTAVDHHVQEEESELLPALQKAVDKKTLNRLGVAFEQARAEELSTAGYEQAPHADDADTDDLANATRDELYEKAKEADIPGRSQMNKESLIQALREHG